MNRMTVQITSNDHSGTTTLAVAIPDFEATHAACRLTDRYIDEEADTTPTGIKLDCLGSCCESLVATVIEGVSLREAVRALERGLKTLDGIKRDGIQRAQASAVLLGQQ